MTETYTDSGSEIKITTTCTDYYNVNNSATDRVNNSGRTIKNCAEFSGEPERLYCSRCFNYYALIILDGDEKNGESGFNRHCISLNKKNDPIV